MEVCVRGYDEDGKAVRRAWTLIAAGGDGPNIPTIPARVMINELLEGRAEPGARPCLGAFRLVAAEALMSDPVAHLDVVTERTEMVDPPLFEDSLGAAFEQLPEALRELHRVLDMRIWEGRARIQRGTSLLANVAASVLGMPGTEDDAPVRVSMRREREGEVWERQFGANRFRSYLRRDGESGSGQIRERFGILSFRIGLEVSDGRLGFPVVAGSCLGVRLPRFLLPVSTTCESVDSEGRPCFDVSISLPLIGHVITYKGWLAASDEMGPQSPASG